MEGLICNHRGRKRDRKQFTEVSVNRERAQKKKPSVHMHMRQEETRHKTPHGGRRNQTLEQKMGNMWRGGCTSANVLGGSPQGQLLGTKGLAGMHPARGSCGGWRAGGNRGHEGPECCDELGAGPSTRMSSPVLPKRPQNPTAGTESARVTDGSGLERGLARSISPFGGV